MADFEPKILAFCCNSVFFFGAPSSPASARKEKNWAKRNLRSPQCGRSLASLGTLEVDD
jgi:hypothetical protein